MEPASTAAATLSTVPIGSSTAAEVNCAKCGTTICIIDDRRPVQLTDKSRGRSSGAPDNKTDAGGGGKGSEARNRDDDDDECNGDDGNTSRWSLQGEDHSSRAAPISKTEAGYQHRSPPQTSTQSLAIDGCRSPPMTNLFHPFADVAQSLLAAGSSRLRTAQQQRQPTGTTSARIKTAVPSTASPAAEPLMTDDCAESRMDRTTTITAMTTNPKKSPERASDVEQRQVFGEHEDEDTSPPLASRVRVVDMSHDAHRDDDSHDDDHRRRPSQRDQDEEVLRLSTAVDGVSAFEKIRSFGSRLSGRPTAAEAAAAGLEDGGGGETRADRDYEHDGSIRRSAESAAAERREIDEKRMFENRVWSAATQLGCRERTTDKEVTASYYSSSSPATVGAAIAADVVMGPTGTAGAEEHEEDDDEDDAAGMFCEDCLDELAELTSAEAEIAERETKMAETALEKVRNAVVVVSVTSSVDVPKVDDLTISSRSHHLESSPPFSESSSSSSSSSSASSSSPSSSPSFASPVVRLEKQSSSSVEGRMKKPILRSRSHNHSTHNHRISNPAYYSSSSTFAAGGSAAAAHGPGHRPHGGSLPIGGREGGETTDSVIGGAASGDVGGGGDRSLRRLRSQREEEEEGTIAEVATVPFERHGHPQPLPSPSSSASPPYRHSVAAIIIRLADEISESVRRLAEVTAMVEVAQEHLRLVLAAERLARALIERSERLVSYRLITHLRTLATRSALQTTLHELEVYTSSLKKCKVLNDSFHIWQDGMFGTINGLRLGKLPGAQVSWAELNAAWGYVALLLEVMAKKLHFEFSDYRILPRGSFSAIVRRSDNAQFELYGCDAGLRGFFSSRKFDQGMTAFLACFQELSANCVISRHELVRIDSGHRLDGCSIRLQFNSDEKWTKALKMTLLNLKTVLVSLSNRSAAASAVRNKNATAQPPPNGNQG